VTEPHQPQILSGPWTTWREAAERALYGHDAALEAGRDAGHGSRNDENGDGLPEMKRGVMSPGTSHRPVSP